MEYRSPIRLVVHADEPVNAYSHQVLIRTRKKILAEMSLQNDEITLDDVTYIRNDVITLFDSITDEAIWQYHCAIYAHQPLLDFLEFNVFDVEGMRTTEELLENQGFASFISPWFAYSFNAVSGLLIKQKDYEALACLLNYRAFIMPEHNQDAFQRIRVYLSDLAHFLKNLNWEKYLEHPNCLYFLFDGNWISFLNKLPGEFAAVRDEMVNRLLTVVERFQRKATWQYLHDCCLRLQYIECNSFMKAEVNRFEEIIGKNVARQESRSSSNASPGRVIFAILWVAIAFFRMANGCNSGSSSSSYNNHDYTLSYQKPDFSNTSPIPSNSNYTENEKAFKSFLDTLSLDTANIDSDKLPSWFEPVTGREAFRYINQPFKQDGQVDITIVNKTGFNCVLFYFDPTDEALKWKEGKPMAYSTFIKNGQTYNVHLDPDKGNLNFYFGKKWVRLKTPLSFAIKDYTFGNNGVRMVTESGQSQDQIFLPGCFLPVENLPQTYLTHDLNLKEHAFDNDNTYKIIHRPDSAFKVSANQKKIKLNLTTVNKEIKLTAQGNLYLTQSL